ncbi:hypothetical protein NQZ68_032617 [Dissostichus eleginoides]|nr:hypothetical protein NQZ68_032617 [Dissostichus eleginoides]
MLPRVDGLSKPPEPETRTRLRRREIKFNSHSLNVLHMELDLANLRSVREFCKSFLQREKKLEILVNNAGMPGVLEWTDDNFSMCFGVNHLGHFLLTNLLLPRLKECAPSRLPFFTYCRSKLANIYFSQEVARITEGKGVTSYAVHPGFVQSGWTCHYSILFRMLVQVIMWMFFVPCEIGAQTVIYCAVSDEAAKHSGGYFIDCRPASLRPFARDAAVAKKLWEASERLVKLA